MIALPALATDRALTDSFIQGTSRKRNQADEHDEDDGDMAEDDGRKKSRA